MNPALGGVMLPQAHSHYDSHAADTNAPNNMLTHIKSGYGFESVYISDTNTFLNPYPLLFVMHIITSQSAGVLHVPACNHDRPPKAGIYFLCTCVVYRITFLTGCAYRHPRSRPVVGADDLLCWQNRGYKE